MFFPLSILPTTSPTFVAAHWQGERVEKTELVARNGCEKRKARKEGKNPFLWLRFDLVTQRGRREVFFPWFEWSSPSWKWFQDAGRLLRNNFPGFKCSSLSHFSLSMFPGITSKNSFFQTWRNEWMNVNKIIAGKSHISHFTWNKQIYWTAPVFTAQVNGHSKC